MNFFLYFCYVVCFVFVFIIIVVGWVVLIVIDVFLVELIVSMVINVVDSKCVFLIYDGVKVVQLLVDFLKMCGGFDVMLVDQVYLLLMEEWVGFCVVFGYVYNCLYEFIELVIIDYIKNGGCFVVFYYMILSGKVVNCYYFDFFGVCLDSFLMVKDIVVLGVGYGWFIGVDKGVEVMLVNLNFKYFIVLYNVEWGVCVYY